MSSPVQERTGKQVALGCGIVIAFILLLTVIIVLVFGESASDDTSSRSTTSRPTPTSTQQLTHNAAFCQDVRSASSNAGLIVERLSSHAKEGAGNPSLLLDSDWRDRASFIRIDLETAAYLFQSVEYSPETQHLRPIIDELATYLERSGMLYEQAILDIDMDMLEKASAWMEDGTSLTKQLQSSIEPLCN